MQLLHTTICVSIDPNLPIKHPLYVVSTMSIPTITIIGSLNTDLISRTTRLPNPGETLTSKSFSTGSGGKGANQAVACARLSRTKEKLASPSVNVRMIGAVGDDEFGGTLIAGLESNGVDTEGVRVVVGQRTGTAVIIVEEETGENRILLSAGANYCVNPSTSPDSLFVAGPRPDLIVLQLEVPVSTVVETIERAREKHILVLLNPAPAVDLPDGVYKGLEHLILNETEAQILAKVGVKSLLEDGHERMDKVFSHFQGLGVHNVIITMGAYGVYWQTIKGPVQHVLGAKVEKVVDTTAAGDTFVGAYAVGVVLGLSVGEAVVRANQAAAKTVEREGAQDAIPWRDDIPISR